jgi:threonyl-tRNA synthetase
MIHRVVLGAMERFVGGLIEHYEGHFPLWLAPVQLRILTITTSHVAYASELRARLQREGFRAELDDRNETMGSKIRDSQLQKIPYTLVVGDKEVADDTVAVRKFKEGPKGSMKTADFIQMAADEVAAKARA